MRLEGMKSVDASALVVAPLLARWSETRPYEGKGQGHLEGRIGASKLGGCSRVLSYSLRSVPKSNPMTESGFHATAIGAAGHKAIQEVVERDGIEGAESVEIERHWMLEIPIEGAEPVLVDSDADLVVHWSEEVVEVVDMKHLASFGFKMKVTKEGPDRSVLLQIGLAMKALGAQRGRVVFLAKEELKGRDRIVHKEGEFDWRENRLAEFVFDWADVEALVEGEIRRLAKVAAYHAEGREVPRTIPGVTPPGATIVGYHAGERKGIWQHWATDETDGTPVLLNTDKTWQCGYCDFRDLCMAELKAETEQNDNEED